MRLVLSVLIRTSSRRCEVRQRGHEESHEDLGRLLAGLQTKLSERTAEKSTSSEECAAQQEAVKVAGRGCRSLLRLPLLLREAPASLTHVPFSPQSR